MNAILRILDKKPNVDIIWPHKFLCQNGDTCIARDNNGFYYYDDNHLSTYGAEQLSPSFIRYF